MSDNKNLAKLIEFWVKTGCLDETRTDKEDYSIGHVLADIYWLNKNDWDVDAYIEKYKIAALRETFNTAAIMEAIGGYDYWDEFVDGALDVLYETDALPINSEPSTENDGTENHLNHS